MLSVFTPIADQFLKEADCETDLHTRILEGAVLLGSLVRSERGRIGPGESLGCDALTTKATADLKGYCGAGLALCLKLGHAIKSLTRHLLHTDCPWDAQDLGKDFF